MCIRDRLSFLYILSNAAMQCIGQTIMLMRLQVSVGGTSGVSAAGRNAVITSLMVCCGYVACWSINQIFFFINTISHSVDFSTWFYHFTVVLALMSSCINPFIYAAKYREFQTAVKRMLGKQVHPSQSDAAGATGQ